MASIAFSSYVVSFSTLLGLSPLFGFALTFDPQHHRFQETLLRLKKFSLTPLSPAEFQWRHVSCGGAFGNDAKETWDNLSLEGRDKGPKKAEASSPSPETKVPKALALSRKPLVHSRSVLNLDLFMLPDDRWLFHQFEDRLIESKIHSKTAITEQELIAHYWRVLGSFLRRMQTNRFLAVGAQKAVGTSMNRARVASLFSWFLYGGGWNVTRSYCYPAHLTLLSLLLSAPYLDAGMRNVIDGPAFGGQVVDPAFVRRFLPVENRFHFDEGDHQPSDSGISNKSEDRSHLNILRRLFGIQRLHNNRERSYQREIPVDFDSLATKAILLGNSTYKKPDGQTPPLVAMPSGNTTSVGYSIETITTTSKSSVRARAKSPIDAPSFDWKKPEVTQPRGPDPYLSDHVDTAYYYEHLWFDLLPGGQVAQRSHNLAQDHPELTPTWLDLVEKKLLEDASDVSLNEAHQKLTGTTHPSPLIPAAYSEQQALGMAMYSPRPSLYLPVLTGASVQYKMMNWFEDYYSMALYNFLSIGKRIRLPKLPRARNAEVRIQSDLPVLLEWMQDERKAATDEGGEVRSIEIRQGAKAVETTPQKLVTSSPLYSEHRAYMEMLKAKEQLHFPASNPFDHVMRQQEPEMKEETPQEIGHSTAVSSNNATSSLEKFSFFNLVHIGNPPPIEVVKALTNRDAESPVPRKKPDADGVALNSFGIFPTLWDTLNTIFPVENSLLRYQLLDYEVQMYPKNGINRRRDVTTNLVRSSRQSMAAEVVEDKKTTAESQHFILKKLKSLSLENEATNWDQFKAIIDKRKGVNDNGEATSAERSEGMEKENTSFTGADIIHQALETLSGNSIFFKDEWLQPQHPAMGGNPNERAKGRFPELAKSWHFDSRMGGGADAWHMQNVEMVQHLFDKFQGYLHYYVAGGTVLQMMRYGGRSVTHLIRALVGTKIMRKMFPADGQRKRGSTSGTTTEKDVDAISEAGTARPVEITESSRFLSEEDQPKLEKLLEEEVLEYLSERKLRQALMTVAENADSLKTPDSEQKKIRRFAEGFQSVADLAAMTSDEFQYRMEHLGMVHWSGERDPLFDNTTSLQQMITGPGNMSKFLDKLAEIVSTAKKKRRVKAESSTETNANENPISSYLDLIESTFDPDFSSKIRVEDDWLVRFLTGAEVLNQQFWEQKFYAHMDRSDTGVYPPYMTLGKKASERRIPEGATVNIIPDSVEQTIVEEIPLARRIDPSLGLKTSLQLRHNLPKFLSTPEGEDMDVYMVFDNIDAMRKLMPEIEVDLFRGGFACTHTDEVVHPYLKSKIRFPIQPPRRAVGPPVSASFLDTALKAPAMTWDIIGNTTGSMDDCCRLHRVFPENNSDLYDTSNVPNIRFVTGSDLANDLAAQRREKQKLETEEEDNFLEQQRKEAESLSDTDDNKASSPNNASEVQARSARGDPASSAEEGQTNVATEDQAGQKTRMDFAFFGPDNKKWGMQYHGAPNMDTLGCTRKPFHFNPQIKWREGQRIRQMEKAKPNGNREQQRNSFGLSRWSPQHYYLKYAHPFWGDYGWAFSKEFMIHGHVLVRNENPNDRHHVHDSGIIKKQKKTSTAAISENRTEKTSRKATPGMATDSNEVLTRRGENYAYIPNGQVCLSAKDLRDGPATIRNHFFDRTHWTRWEDLIQHYEVFQAKYFEKLPEQDDFPSQRSGNALTRGNSFPLSDPAGKDAKNLSVTELAAIQQEALRAPTTFVVDDSVPAVVDLIANDTNTLKGLLADAELRHRNELEAVRNQTISLLTENGTFDKWFSHSDPEQAAQRARYFWVGSNRIDDMALDTKQKQRDKICFYLSQDFVPENIILKSAHNRLLRDSLGVLPLKRIDPKFSSSTNETRTSNRKDGHKVTEAVENKFGKPSKNTEKSSASNPSPAAKEDEQSNSRETETESPIITPGPISTVFSHNKCRYAQLTLPCFRDPEMIFHATISSRKVPKITNDVHGYEKSCFGLPTKARWKRMTYFDWRLMRAAILDLERKGFVNVAPLIRKEPKCHKMLRERGWEF